jgi:2-polyprenyl-3-methyl-5-hydroxy-6-metoxy-1,4-benzoquinol methylase
MNSHASKQRIILASLLVCPLCRGGLKEGAEQYECLSCRRIYPVRGGIPRFLPDLSSAEQQVKRSFNLEHSRYLDSHYLHFGERLVQQWLDDIKLPAEYFKDKVVLDAGCGSGRWTYAMSSLGATVVAVDLTDAGVEVTHQATAQLDNVVVLQASVLHLPFRPESFDVVVSWGVLHHTPDTKAAFDRLVPLVKRGGILYVMVYERHNPLKFLVTDTLRWCLRRLPDSLRYKACRALMVRSKRLYYRLSKLLICALYPESGDSLEVSTAQLGLYDAYSPVFNHLHTRDEVRSWFEEHKFDRVTLTRPVYYTAQREVRLYGECAGSVTMRGVRT